MGTWKAVSVGREVPPIKVGSPDSYHRYHDVEGFAELTNPTVIVREGVPMRFVLRLVPAGTDGQLEPPFRIGVQSTGHLRQKGGVSEADRSDHRPVLYPASRCGDRAKACPTLRRIDPAPVVRREQVV